MKKARVIEWKDELTEEEYDDYYKHALNSSIWYINNYPGHSSKLIKRLKEKGYLDEDVIVLKASGEKEHINILQKAMKDLDAAGYLRDESIVEGFMESFKKRGYGYKIAALKVSQKGIPMSEIEKFESLFTDDEELFDSLDRIYEKVIRSSRYGKLPDYQKSMFVKSKFYERGFDSDTINAWYEEREVLE